MKREALITNTTKPMDTSVLHRTRSRCGSQRDCPSGWRPAGTAAPLSLGLAIGLLLCGGNLLALGQDSRADGTAAYRTETNILFRAETDRSDYARERCRLDLYYPTDRTDFATVVWFHGGGLTGGDHLFLTAVESGDPQALLTLAIDRHAGRILWRQQVQSDRPGAFHALNNAASAAS